MLGQIYPTEPQLNKANSAYTEAPFLDLDLSITIIYNKGSIDILDTFSCFILSRKCGNIHLT